MSDVAMPPPIKLLPPPLLTNSTEGGDSNVTQQRRRGRPPGSKNRPKEGEVHSTLGTGRPQGRPTGSTTQPKTDEEKKADAERVVKQQRAEEYAELIHKELNDQLFTAIIGMRLLPAEAIYKQGHIPPTSQPDPTLTEWGNMIAIPTDLSKNVGKLLAELSMTGPGKTVVGVTQGNTAGLVMATIATLWATYRYTQQLKPFLDMVKAAQEKQANEDNPSVEG